MNKIIAMFLLNLCASTIVSAAGIEYLVGVDGLACPFCTYGIEKQLQKLEGVAELKTDIAQGLVKIGMQEGKSLTEAKVRQAVKKAGFSLRSFARTE